MSAFAVAILAGGKSSRMGTDKSFVPLLGRPLIEHLLARVTDLGQAETLLITNRPDVYVNLALPVYPDVMPEKGPLGGIYSALHYSPSPYTLVVACDLPFVNPALLRYMLNLRAAEGGPFDVVVPRVARYPQGLHAVYSQRCLEPIRADLEANRLKVIGFYERVRVRYLDEPEYEPFDAHGLSFFNVNTPDELARAQRLAGEGSAA